jgi:Protein of unknown function (DUF4199)
MEDQAIETTTTWYQDAAKKGLILGIIHILIFPLLYYTFPSKLTGFSYLFFIMVFNFGYLIFHGINYRKEVGGYIEFGPVFKYVLVILVANGIVNTIFMAVFLLLEPGYPEIMAQSQLDTSIYWAQRFGAPEASLDEMREKFDFEDISKRYNYGGLLFGFGIALIFYVLAAAIVGLFIRKRVPETF